MAEAGVLVVILGSLFTLLTSFLLFRGTVLDLCCLRSNPWPLLFYVEVLLVLVPLAVVAYLGVDQVPVLFVSRPGIEWKVAFLTNITLILYFLSLSLGLRALGLNSNISLYKRFALDDLERWTIALALVGGLFLFLFMLLGYKHAFVYSFLDGENLLSIRLSNVYASKVPTQLSSVLPVLGYVLSALSGYLARKNRIKGLMYLACALFFLSAPGDKAPVVWGFVIWLLAEGSVLPQRLFSLRLAFSMSFVFFLALSIAFLAWNVQRGDSSNQTFVEYLLGRLGVGQMAGVFETLSLFEEGYLPEGQFFWHAIPGAGVFVDYVDYQKALMMITEGYAEDEMGVKNTYFIAEALAIAGIPGLFLSPILVGISNAAGLYLLRILFRKLLRHQLAPHLATLVYLKTHGITGGFASFPLLKGLILLALQLLMIWFISFVILRVIDFVKIALVQIRKRRSTSDS